MAGSASFIPSVSGRLAAVLGFTVALVAQPVPAHAVDSFIDFLMVSGEDTNGDGTVDGTQVDSGTVSGAAQASDSREIGGDLGTPCGGSASVAAATASTDTTIAIGASCTHEAGASALQDVDYQAGFDAESTVSFVISGPLPEGAPVEDVSLQVVIQGTLAISVASGANIVGGAGASHSGQVFDENGIPIGGGAWEGETVISNDPNDCLISIPCGQATGEGAGGWSADLSDPNNPFATANVAFSRDMGTLSVGDILTVAAQFGTGCTWNSPSAGGPLDPNSSANCTADFSNTFSYSLSSTTAGVQFAVVPEPGSGALLLSALAALAGCRRRLRQTL